MDAKLERLLIKAGICSYDRWLWFREATFTGHVIVTVDEDLRQSIQRCWLPQIRLICPECAVAVGTVQQPSVLKKGKAWHGQTAEPSNQRLLD